MTPFAAYIAPARARPQIWRLAAGLILCTLVMVLWVGALLGLVLMLTGVQAAQDWAARMPSGGSPTATLLMLFGFTGLALGPALAARVLHGRSPRTLLGPPGAATRDFIRAVAVVAAIYGLGLAVWGWGYDTLPNLDPGVWLTFLPLALVAVLIQTGAEELLFRGYIMQQLAARFASPLVWMALPALVFGALHYDPAQATASALGIVAATTVFGLIAADLTRRSGNLGAAWGLHFANNTLAILLVATQDTITGLALRVTPYGVETIGPALMLGDAAMLGVVWLVLRRVTGR
ncbi:Abortive infection protein [Oceaniovalibus guishaninsula JLT2003]|uniref:Abortive infection protein n=1 Tax=Oceaniovalibus guishaninsula JLT2003 TaxID=1231392 RepID=K2GP63_9RHOB|nr:CPBP family intramembrane glutamic endopeptidase [Oceaniovalibus guishaninsula]EKE44486.1 Abortive infection protein [Oceaniovalibus guishaninsula JLT2003]